MELLRLLPLPVVVVGPDERVGFVNEAAQALFGQGLQGRHYLTAMRQPAAMDCIETALRKRVPAQAEYLTTRDSHQVSYRINAVPFVAEGAGDSALIAFEDLTQVQQANQMRRDFVANVSHELRTPLTAILGYIQTLQGAARNDAEARERFLTAMAGEAARMNRLISDLLSLSRVEAEERMRPVAAIDVAALIRNAVEVLAPQAVEHRVTVTVDLENPAATLRGDADQILQLFINLLENAIKYGAHPGEVRIEMAQSAHEPLLRGPAIIVTFTDQGQGIDPVHIPRLTERFYRVDSHRSRQMGGTGLGLAIAKHVINRHRGRLRISSEPGQGSRFSVILPAG